MTDAWTNSTVCRQLMSEKGMNGYEELRKYFVSQLFQILNDELGLNVGVYEDMLQGDDTFMNTTELLQTR